MGDHALQSRSKLLIAAAFFALIAIAAFLVVWQWPHLFNMGGNEESSQQELTAEEKADVLTQVRLSASEAPPSADEKTKAINSVSKSSTGSSMSQEEKLQVLRSLNAQ